jgi:mono/diheme cytochrome c family protein
LAARLAVLAVALLLATPGCTTAPDEARDGATRDSCRSCHAPHQADRGACQECHRGNPASSRQALAHARLLTGHAAAHLWPHGATVVTGRSLVAAAACRRCHRMGGTGNTLAADLDRVAWDRDQAQLAASIDLPVDNMPAFGFDGQQTHAVIAFLLSHRQRSEAQASYRVHFSKPRTADAAGPFDGNCGGCHRALTADGPLGTGTQGPNLSGLFGEHYPRTASSGERWSPTMVREWVRNPRRSRPGTTMPPQALADQRLREVVRQLGGTAPE